MVVEHQKNFKKLRNSYFLNLLIAVINMIYVMILVINQGNIVISIFINV